MSRPVLLFKDPTTDLSYETTLGSKGLVAKCIPVLHTVHTNMAGLADYLSNAKKLEIRGVITTSKRSCESLGEALKGLCSNSGVGAAESLGRCNCS